MPQTQRPTHALESLSSNTTILADEQRSVGYMNSPLSPVSPSKRLWFNSPIQQRPRWRCEGEATRREGKRAFYDSVVRTAASGEATVFRVGDEAFITAPDTDIPYIARIEAMFEEGRGGGIMCLLKWYYRSSEVTREKHRSYSPWEIFEAQYVDENPVESILRKAYVLPQKLYAAIGGDRCDDVFFCRESFSPPTNKCGRVSDEWSKRDFSRAIDELNRRKTELSYQEPKIGPAHQCWVPSEPPLSYSPPKGFEGEQLHCAAGVMNGGERGKAAVQQFLRDWDSITPGSVGTNNEVAFNVLYSCEGDVHRARGEMTRLCQQGVPLTGRSGTRIWSGVPVSLESTSIGTRKPATAADSASARKLPSSEKHAQALDRSGMTEGPPGRAKGAKREPVSVAVDVPQVPVQLQAPHVEVLWVPPLTPPAPSSHGKASVMRNSEVSSIKQVQNRVAEITRRSLLMPLQEVVDSETTSGMRDKDIDCPAKEKGAGEEGGSPISRADTPEAPVMIAATPSSSSTSTHSSTWDAGPASSSASSVSSRSVSDADEAGAVSLVAASGGGGVAVAAKGTRSDGKDEEEEDASGGPRKRRRRGMGGGGATPSSSTSSSSSTSAAAAEAATTATATKGMSTIVESCTGDVHRVKMDDTYDVQRTRGGQALESRRGLSCAFSKDFTPSKRSSAVKSVTQPCRPMTAFADSLGNWFPGQVLARHSGTGHVLGKRRRGEGEDDDEAAVGAGGGGGGDGFGLKSAKREERKRKDGEVSQESAKRERGGGGDWVIGERSDSGSNGGAAEVEEEGSVARSTRHAAERMMGNVAKIHSRPQVAKVPSRAQPYLPLVQTASRSPPRNAYADPATKGTPVAGGKGIPSDSGKVTPSGSLSEPRSSTRSSVIASGGRRTPEVSPKGPSLSATEASSSSSSSKAGEDQGAHRGRGGKVLKKVNSRLESVSWNGRVYKAGDCVRLESPPGVAGDYIARILSIYWGGSEAMMKCRWYYFLDDVPKAHRVVELSGSTRDRLVMEENEVLASEYIDVNSIETVMGPCRVVHKKEYEKMSQKAKADKQSFFISKRYCAARRACLVAGPDWERESLKAHSKT